MRKSSFEAAALRKIVAARGNSWETTFSVSSAPSLKYSKEGGQARWVARPAGFEPATHSLEGVRFFLFFKEKICSFSWREPAENQTKCKPQTYDSGLQTVEPLDRKSTRLNSVT